MSTVYLNISDYTDADMLFSYWMKRKIDLFSKDKWHGKESSTPNLLHLEIDKELARLRPARTPNLPLFVFDSGFNFYRFKRSGNPKIENAPEIDAPNEEFLIEQKN